MAYEIKPYEGAGPIKFGMSADEVRKVVGAQWEAISKSDSGIPSDAFDSVGILVYYRPPVICDAIEFAGPQSPTFQDQQLLKRPYRELEMWLKALDDEVVLEDTGLTSYKFGFALYAPFALKLPNETVQGVFVFEKGYYEKYM